VDGRRAASEHTYNHSQIRPRQRRCAIYRSHHRKAVSCRGLARDAAHHRWRDIALSAVPLDSRYHL